MIRHVIIAAAALAAQGCAISDGPQSEALQPIGPILVNSVPAEGSRLSSPPESLRLHFDPPVRLDELSIKSPQGTMAVMVDAAGRVANYDIPLPYLGPGDYAVGWAATGQKRIYRGTIRFTVTAALDE